MGGVVCSDRSLTTPGGVPVIVHIDAGRCRDNPGGETEGDPVLEFALDTSGYVFLGTIVGVRFRRHRALGAEIVAPCWNVAVDCVLDQVRGGVGSAAGGGRVLACGKSDGIVTIMRGVFDTPPGLASRAGECLTQQLDDFVQVQFGERGVGGIQLCRIMDGYAAVNVIVAGCIFDGYGVCGLHLACGHIRIGSVGEEHSGL